MFFCIFFLGFGFLVVLWVWGRVGFLFFFRLFWGGSLLMMGYCGRGRLIWLGL